MIDETALMRGGTAGIAIFAALLTVAALLYTGRLRKIEEDGDEKILILASVARALRWLAILNTILLVYLSTAYLLRFFYALPRPRLEPAFIFWVNLGALFIPPLLATLPAVILFSIAIRIRKEKDQACTPRVSWHFIKKSKDHD